MTNKPCIDLFNDDLPENFPLGSQIAVDTEAMGLNIHNDRLCLIQIATELGKYAIIKINNPTNPAPNLIQALSSSKILKIFHFARFDAALLSKTFEVDIKNIFCTKVASKIARTFTSKHGLKDLCQDLLNIELCKQEQTSDWGASNLSPAQLNYAITDVIHLHKLKNELEKVLMREGRVSLFQDSINALDSIIKMDIKGINPSYIFSH